MPFSLTNALATFHKPMNHAFKEYFRELLEVYMDDFYVHYFTRKAFINHLIKVFEKCKTYCICLNPERCAFIIRQERIMGHIVSKKGISIYFNRSDLLKPQNVKEVQAFMGHCGYYRTFIYMYTIISKPIYSLIIVFEWTK